MNIARHMELTKMQAGKEEQEQWATKDFQKIEQYFKEFCETQAQLGMSEYLICARNYPQGYLCGKELQGSSTKYSRNNREDF